MCRFVAYVGEEATLESVVLKYPHNLIEQSYAPKEQVDGKVNLDGFGCGWYNPRLDERPALYATLLPPWADVNFPTIARVTSSNVVFAAVRNATPPLPTELSSVQPLREGSYLFVHNGHIEDFEHLLRREMTEDLPDEYYSLISARSDSALLFAATLWKLSEEEKSARALTDALKSMIDWVSGHLQKHHLAANLNLGLTDGKSAVFFRHEINGYCNSLYYNDSHPGFPRGALVASEAFDDQDSWTAVPENSLVETTGDGKLEVEPVR